MGGDILYRWGNPRTYRAGDSTDQRFFGQHDARWIEPGLPGAGHVMVFNNGLKRPGSNYSTVDEFVPACDSSGRYPRPAPGTPFGPDTLVWMYRADPPTGFFSGNMSGAHRLPGGNTFICSGAGGTLTEVTPDAAVVWRYVNPVIESGPLYQGGPTNGVNVLFRATLYQSDYPGLAGRNLTPGYPVERYRTPPSGITVYNSARTDAALSVTPNPCHSSTTISCSSSLLIPHSSLSLYDITGKLVFVLRSSFFVPRSSFFVLRSKKAIKSFWVLRASLFSDIKHIAGQIKLIYEVVQCVGKDQRFLAMRFYGVRLTGLRIEKFRVATLA